MLNFSAVLAWVAQVIAHPLYQECRHAYRVNFANELSKMKDNLVRLFLFEAPDRLFTTLVLAMATSTEVVRLDRFYRRKTKPANLQGVHPNFKPCR